MDHKTVSMGRRLPISELQRINPNKPLIPRQHRVSSCCAFELHSEILNWYFLYEKPGFSDSTIVAPIAGLEAYKVFDNLQKKPATLSKSTVLRWVTKVDANL